MNLEGEYAVDKAQRVHRVASMIVFCLWVGFVWWARGLGYGIRAGAGLVLPMACIWFPDALGSYRGILLGKGRPITMMSHPVFLRWAGWFVLLVPAAVLLLQWW